MEFSGKNVLITGGASGFGLAIAKQFYAAKAKVFVLDKNEEALTELKNQHPDIKTVVVDLQNWNETKKAVESLGMIHHLVNNAGIVKGAQFLNISEEDVDLTFGVNFKSYISVSQCVAKTMIANGVKGTIVNVASVAAKTVWPALSMYCASKSAVCSLTKSMALELAAKNVRVNCVCPTLMETAMTRGSIERLSAVALDRQPVKKIMLPEEAAKAVLFLSSEKSCMIHGENLNVDYGYLCT